MVAPSKPLWLVNSWTRELKLRFDRAARGGERVVTFESDLLIQLDEKRLPKGVTCTSTDSAKQQYSFHFGFKAAPIVSFYISARKAENSTSVLSVAVEGGPERHSFDLRINTHNPTGWLDWAFLARSALRELPRPWRYTTLAVTLLLLIIAPPWFWKNAPVLGVRAGILSDLTTAPFVDDFSHGAGQWRLSGDCAGIPSKTDNLGVPQRTFLRLSSPCFAVARLQSSIEGFHPLSRDPSAADFTATLGIQFRWKDDSGITRVAHEATILLHAERAYPWLAPILGEKVRVSPFCYTQSGLTRGSLLFWARRYGGIASRLKSFRSRRTIRSPKDCLSRLTVRRRAQRDPTANSLLPKERPSRE